MIVGPPLAQLATFCFCQQKSTCNAFDANRTHFLTHGPLPDLRTFTTLGMQVVPATALGTSTNPDLQQEPITNMTPISHLRREFCGQCAYRASNDEAFNDDRIEQEEHTSNQVSFCLHFTNGVSNTLNM